MKHIAKGGFYRFLSFLLAFLILSLQLPLAALAEELDEPEETTRTGYVTHTDVNVRKGPGTNHPNIGNGTDIRVNKPQKLTVHGEAEPDQNGDLWYHVTFTHDRDGMNYEGYIFAEYVAIVEENDEEPEENLNFEEQLARFPESYRAKLTALHALHPSWNFEAFETGLDWKIVQTNENTYGRSMINDGILSHYSTDKGYDWETDTYSVLEGSDWYQAHPNVVAYYMDPRNFLNENDIFQFEKLTFNSASQTEEAIASMLKGSFMEGKTTLGPDGEEISYAKAFLLAAQASRVSAFHLITRCIQEVGWNGSACSLGTFSGFENYYNFFNIGAYSGAYDGMVYAKNQGWDSPYKAIYAGAFFIMDGYISVGQDTPYFQKFSVVDEEYYYWHQYMTNVAAANSEGHIQRVEYLELGLIETPFTFRIPVYEKMPETPAKMPAATGSPNNYLTSLSVEGYSLTPSFDFYDCLYDGVDSYTLIITGNVSTVQVRATAAGKAATVSGSVGSVSIWTGENVLQIKVTAANGDVKTYTLRIILNGQGSSGEAPPPPAVDPDEPENPDGPTPPVVPDPVPSGWEHDFTVKGNLIAGLSVGLSVEEFLDRLGLYGLAVATLSDENGKTVASGVVRTGLVLSYYDGARTTVYTLVLYGDVNGDTTVDAVDLLWFGRKC
ncbi:MAG: hypothetical protein IKC69_03815 [Clostridia bacterium]|nr:hypothetical protein [Clostridia bacterium]